MRKLLNIAWKEVFLTFSDRSLLLIMLAAPLMIATIVGMAFGGLGGSGLTIEQIPVGIVNLDTGSTQQGQTLNYGDILTGILIPGTGGEPTDSPSFADCPLVSDTTEQPSSAPIDISLDELILAETLTDIDAGRAMVDSGDYVALIVIPEDFSSHLALAIDPFGENETDPVDPTFIEVYANSGSQISASIVRSIIQGFTNQFRSGNIAINAAINTLADRNPLALIQLNSNEAATSVFSCAFTDVLNTITIDPQALTTADREDGFDYSLTTDIMVGIGAAQSVLFALFAGQFGVLGILQERKQGTLQRMVTTPTNRYVILAGNLMGTFATIVFQISLLLISLMFIASLVEGQLALIWGTNLLAIIVLVLALAVCVAGLGVMIVGAVRTPEQVSAFGIIFNMVMGLVGGAFGFPAMLPVGYISPIYWGVDGFTKLSRGNTAIGLNIGVLLVIGAILFAIGTWLFNRRLDI